MKFLQRLARAWRWYRLGCSAHKAWLLAAPTGRKQTYNYELLVITALALAYVLVAWNDADTTAQRLGHEYASAMMQKNKAEIALVDMLSGKQMMIDAKSWTQCYSSTVM